ncbi:MAG: macro domain-containing protein [Gammaproteobacteria bacterium]|nr:macro domain-containing protein [Gammaproteobacteria bacterium]
MTDASATAVSRNGVSIECVKGDIARQPDMDAVVNAANAQLQSGGGVAGAIHRAAGPALTQECAAMAPIRPGEAVISGAHGLPNRYVIHCLGPVYGHDGPEAELLAACYRNALDLAEAHDLRAVAFPALSTGIFGYPMAEAAKVAFRTLLARARSLKSVRHIRFVLFDAADLELHTWVLNDIAGEDNAT